MRRRIAIVSVLVLVLALSTLACGGDGDGDSASGDTATSSENATTSTILTEITYGDEATYLTGTVEDFSIDQGTVTSDDSGASHWRDGTIEYRVVSTDPRVSGTVTGTWHSDRWGTGISNGAIVQWGEATLTTDEGSWKAPYSGVFATPFGDMIARWWVGAGAYEGLTFYMSVPGSEVGSTEFEWMGLIYPGNPPPPDQAASPTE